MLKDTADLQRSMGRGTGLYTARFRAPIQTIVKDEDGNDKVVTVGHTRQSVDSPDLVEHKARVQAERDKAAAARVERVRQQESDRLLKQALNRQKREEGAQASQARERSSRLRTVGTLRAQISGLRSKVGGLEGSEGATARVVLSTAEDMMSRGDYSGARDLLAYRKTELNDAVAAATERNKAPKEPKPEKTVTGTALQQAFARRSLGKLSRAFDTLDISERSSDRLKGAFGAYAAAASAAKDGDFAKADEILIGSKKDFAQVLKEAKEVQKRANKTTDEAAKSQKEMASRYAMVSAAGFFGRHVSSAATGIVGDPAYGFGTGAIGVGRGLSGAASRYGAGMVVRHGLSSGIGLLGAGIGVVGGAVSLGLDIVGALAERGKGVIHDATARKGPLEEQVGRMMLGRSIDMRNVPGVRYSSPEAVWGSGVHVGLMKTLYGGKLPHMVTREAPGATLLDDIMGTGTALDLIRSRSDIIATGPQALSAHPFHNLGAVGEIQATRERIAMRNSRLRIQNALSGPDLGMTSEMIAQSMGLVNSAVTGYGEQNFIDMVRMAESTGVGTKAVIPFMNQVRRGLYSYGGTNMFKTGVRAVGGLIGAEQRLGLPAGALLASVASDYEMLAKAGVYGGLGSNLFDTAAYAQRLVGGGVSGEGVPKLLSMEARATAGARGLLTSGGKGLLMAGALARAAKSGGTFLEQIDLANSSYKSGDNLRFVADSLGSDAAKFAAMSEGVSLADATKALEAKNEWFPNILKMSAASFDARMAPAGSEASQATFAEKEAHQIAAMARFSSALDQAAVKVANFANSFSPGYTPGIVD